VSWRIESRLPTEEQEHTLVTLLRAGNPIKVAADFANVGERSVYEWLSEAAGDDPRPRVVQLAQAIKEARAGAQASALQVVTRAANTGTWQAAAWFLERSNPANWGRWERRELEVSVTTEPRSVRDQLAEAMTAMAEELDDEDELFGDDPLPRLRAIDASATPGDAGR
jgi:hypothetical protein